MINKQSKYIAVAIVMIAVAALILAVAWPGNANASSKYTIRANVNKDCSSTPWFVAAQKGYFQNASINLDDKGALSWSLQPAALVGGQIDVYDGHPDTIINLLLSGAQVHAVAVSAAEPEGSGDTSSGDLHWLVLDGSPYQTVQDLVAHGHTPKIGVSAPGFCMKLDSSGWYMDNNITMGAFEFVVVPEAQQEDALRAGTIDVATLSPSYYDVVKPRGGLRVISTSIDPSGAIAETTLLVFTDEFIKDHPDAVRAFIVAYKNAERWSNDHPSESGALTAETIGARSVTSHWYSYTGAITDELLQPWIDALVSDGTLTSGQIRPSDLYTTEFSDLWVNKTAPQPLDPHGPSAIVADTAGSLGLQVGAGRTIPYVASVGTRW
jgi:ABC-type nitrate/sulfonate/bicarbonate transport system substrate-binding protein